MQYKFDCDCGHSFTEEMSPKAFDKIEGEGIPCPECDSNASYDFEPGDLDVCFQGGGWRDKSLRERKYRQKRSQKLARRQKEKHNVPELQPNFRGQPTESWREARALAEKEDGYIHETYDPKVEDEQDD
jgi:hypothetical protein